MNEAIVNARENAMANGLGSELILGVGSVREILDGGFPFRSAPLVAANILAPVIVRLLQDGLVDVLSPGGQHDPGWHPRQPGGTCGGGLSPGRFGHRRAATDGRLDRAVCVALKYGWHSAVASCRRDGQAAKFRWPFVLSLIRHG